MGALLFLSRVLEAHANKPVFAVEGDPWYSRAFLEVVWSVTMRRSGNRRVGVIGALKGRTRTASLNRIMKCSPRAATGPGSRRDEARRRR